MAVNAEHLTANGASYLAYAGATGANVNAINCIFASVTSLSANGNTTFNGLNNGFYSAPSFGSSQFPTDSNPFQSVGKGAHYLAGSTFRNVGTTSINSTLAADLKHRTTYAPIVRTSDFTGNTTLSREAPRDTDTPDLGYHYDPLDYCWSGLNLISATLTLADGVAVANYGTKGTVLRNGAQFVSEGTPTALNRLTRYTTVQEQPLAWGTTGATIALLEFNGNASPLPQVRLRFTDLSMLADTLSKRQLLNTAGGANVVSLLSLQDCQWRGLYHDGRALTGYVMSIALVNNLFERGNVSLGQNVGAGYQPFTLNCYNNLFVRGAAGFSYDSPGTTWTVKDNFFDCDSLWGGAAAFNVSHNGYRSGLTSLGGSGNVTGLVPDYQNGPAANWFGVVGRYYYPAGGGTTSLKNLLDVGSRSSAAAGLFHYTILSGQAKDGFSTVDMGYHYVSTNGSGIPLDVNSDGTADYAADKNGNGVIDTGETAWFNNPLGLWGTPFNLGECGWSTPKRAIHAHLLPTGKVLFFEDNLPALYDPNVTQNWSTPAAWVTYRIFCSGHCFMSDGTLFVGGGHNGTGCPADS